MGYCINRIRLEFKVYCHSDSGCFLLPVLIESDWNLKVLYPDLSQTLSRINRIRLEFKGGAKRYAFHALSCINRIRLEFKVNESFAICPLKDCINRIRLEFKDNLTVHGYRC